MNQFFTALITAIISLNISFLANAEVPEVKPKVAPAFGKVFEMAGTIRQTKPNEQMKRPGPEWFIEITEVDGKKFAKAVVIEFSTKFPGAPELDVKKDGLALKIAAYETGQFGGIPHNFSKYESPWQDVGFHFSRVIVIVKILD